MIYYPCLCLCFAVVQITRTTRFRRIILHLLQIGFTEALTFMNVVGFERILYSGR